MAQWQREVRGSQQEPEDLWWVTPGTPALSQAWEGQGKVTSLSARDLAGAEAKTGRHSRKGLPKKGVRTRLSHCWHLCSAWLFLNARKSQCETQSTIFCSLHALSIPVTNKQNIVNSYHSSHFRDGATEVQKTKAAGSVFQSELISLTPDLPQIILSA